MSSAVHVPGPQFSTATHTFDGHISIMTTAEKVAEDVEKHIKEFDLDQLQRMLVAITERISGL